MFSARISAWKWTTEPAFEDGRFVASPMTKMFSCVLRPQRLGVGRDEAQLVAEAGALDDLGAHVRRDGDEEIVGDLAPVVADDLAGRGVDALRAEIGDDADLALVEQRAERGGRHRLREGAGERRHVDDVDRVAELAPREVRVAEERELERGDGTLDGHLDDVDREPARP